MEDRVSISIADGIADVRLVRADKMNALDQAMFEALVAATERLSKEKAVRVVVLSGEGRAFCAGLDMGRFAAMKDTGGNGVAGGESRDLSRRTHGLANFPQQAVWGWRQLPVPVIAAIQGVAFGGGFQLALGADIRLMAPDARMSIMEIKWGLVPDMAGTPILASLVRDDILRDLTYTGRIFSAQEAFELRPRHPHLRRPARRGAWRWRARFRPRTRTPSAPTKRMLNNLSVDPGPALAGGVRRAAKTARQPQPDRSRPRQHGKACAQVCGGGLTLTLRSGVAASRRVKATVSGMRYHAFETLLRRLLTMRV